MAYNENYMAMFNKKMKGSINIVEQHSSKEEELKANKQNAQYPVNQIQTIQHHPYQRQIARASDDDYFTIKKAHPYIRQSQYYLHRNSSSWNSKCFRFSEHAERVKSTNPSLNESQEQSLHQPLTFGSVRDSLSMKPENTKIQNQQLRCFNHFNKEAKFYLLLAQQERDNSSNKLYYCERCAVNIKQQGFLIHSISESEVFSPFLSKLNQYIKKIQQNMNSLSTHSYLQEIQLKANQISKKYDNIIEIMLEFKKQELLQLEKYKFEMFEYVTRRQKELEGSLKKLELLNESYIKNCDFEEDKKEESQNQLYWKILEKDNHILDVDICAEIKNIAINEEVFLDELQICQKLITAFKERVYQLSFEEEKDQGPSHLLDGLNATFGENECA